MIGCSVGMISTTGVAVGVGVTSVGMIDGVLVRAWHENKKIEINEKNTINFLRFFIISVPLIDLIVHL